MSSRLMDDIKVCPWCGEDVEESEYPFHANVCEKDNNSNV